MRVTARVDYAVRALVQLASDASVEPVKAEQLATAQQIPLKFLLEILRQLKQHKLLVSRRGPEGGYTLAKPAAEIAIADVIRAVEGPLATVRDTSPASLAYVGPTEPLRTVWIAVRGSLRHVLEDVTLAGRAHRQAAEARRGDRREVRRRRAALVSGPVSGPDPAYTVVPANEASWEDLRTVFGTRGTTYRCYCQRYKLAPREFFAGFPAEDRAHRLREQADCDHPRSGRTSGLVAYLDGEPVGLVRRRAAQCVRRSGAQRAASRGSAARRTRPTTASGR